MTDCVCFGEVLLRLTPPERELLLQTPRLTVSFGGAEANVAVSLAALGSSAKMVSIVPENALGRAARDELRRRGVDVSAVRFGPGRMGIYFATPGAVMRPAQVLYDRAGSAFTRADLRALDWDRELAGAGWLHVSGVTAALDARCAEAVIQAARAANRLDVPASFDCNYRATLWSGREDDAPGVFRELMSCATIVFGDERDLTLALGSARGAGGVLERRRAAAAAFAAFPRLTRVASTIRVRHSSDCQGLSAVMFTRDGGEYATRPSRLQGIVDRIGAGDAFAAGLLHALRTGSEAREALDFALAAAALKHAIPGDFNLAGEAEVRALLAGDTIDVRR